PRGGTPEEKEGAHRGAHPPPARQGSRRNRHRPSTVRLLPAAGAEHPGARRDDLGRALPHRRWTATLRHQPGPQGRRTRRLRSRLRGAGAELSAPPGRAALPPGLRSGQSDAGGLRGGGGIPRRHLQGQPDPYRRGRLHLRRRPPFRHRPALSLRSGPLQSELPRSGPAARLRHLQGRRDTERRQAPGDADSALRQPLFPARGGAAAGGAGAGSRSADRRRPRAEQAATLALRPGLRHRHRPARYGVPGAAARQPRGASRPGRGHGLGDRQEVQRQLSEPGRLSPHGRHLFRRGLCLPEPEDEREPDLQAEHRPQPVDRRVAPIPLARVPARAVHHRPRQGDLAPAHSGRGLVARPRRQPDLHDARPESADRHPRRREFDPLERHVRAGEGGRNVHPQLRAPLPLHHPGAGGRHADERLPRPAADRALLRRRRPERARLRLPATRRQGRERSCDRRQGPPHRQRRGRLHLSGALEVPRQVGSRRLLRRRQRHLVALLRHAGARSGPRPALGLPDRPGPHRFRAGADPAGAAAAHPLHRWARSMTSADPAPPAPPAPPVPAKKHRLRRFLLWSAGALLVLLLLLGAAVWFLLGTQGGTRFLFTRLGALMPGSLSVAQLNGPLRGPLDIHGLVYERDGLTMRIDHVQLEWRLTDLLARRLDIQKLYASGVRIIPTPSKEPAKKGPLPDVNLRFNIAVHDARVTDLQIAAPGQQPFVVDRIDLVTRETGGRFQVERFTVRSPMIDAAITGSFQPRGDYPVDLQTQWTVRPPGVASAFSGRGPLTGTLEKLRVSQTLSAPFPARLDTLLTEPLNDLRFDGKLTFSDFNPRLIKADLPDVPASGEVRVQGNVDSFSSNGTVRSEARDIAGMAGVGPVAVTYKAAREGGDRWRIDSAAITLPGTTTRIDASGLITAPTGKPVTLEAALRWQNLRWPLRTSDTLVESVRGEAKLNGR